jgi:hypothetical protein
MIKPQLLEPKILNNIQTSLLQCKKYRFNYYSKVFNIFMFILFCLLLGIILLNAKKNKDNKLKNIKENKIKLKQNILEVAKLSMKQQNEKHKLNGNLITELPQINKIFI